MRSFFERLQNILPPDTRSAKIIVTVSTLFLYWLIVWIIPFFLLFLFTGWDSNSFQRAHADFAQKFIAALTGFPYWYVLFLWGLAEFAVRDILYYFFFYFFLAAPLLAYFHYRFLRMFFRNSQISMILLLVIPEAILPMIYIYIYILSNITAPKF